MLLLEPGTRNALLSKLAFCFILFWFFVLGFLLSEKFLSSNAPKQWRERERAYSAARGAQKENWRALAIFSPEKIGKNFDVSFPRLFLSYHVFGCFSAM
jgi:hypothetical protein